MLRTPRWVGLTAVALVAIVGFGFLSHWQWERALRDEASSAQAADPAPVPLATIVGTAPLPAAAYGRQVTVAGTYDASAQRVLDRGAEQWVVTPLRPGDGGPVVAVARGQVDSGPAPPPPGGTVTVTGRIEPYDGDPGAQPGDAQLPPGQLPRLTASAIAPLVAGPVAGGWVALTESTPAEGLPAVTGPSAPEGAGGLHWQNASYAAQWVLFAGFAVFLWWRWFRDDLAEARGASGDAPVAA